MMEYNGKDEIQYSGMKEYSGWKEYIRYDVWDKGGWWMGYSAKIQWNLWKTLGGMGD